MITVMVGSNSYDNLSRQSKNLEDHITHAAFNPENRFEIL
jgi:hypothetical protein